jgi:hypothetical protein
MRRQTQHFEIKPQSHLVNIIKNTKDHHPNFVTFLGAGASVTSGVSSASVLISQWRRQYYSMYGNNLPSEQFFSGEYWYNSEEEYSILFEMLYDEPSQRREFIESCIANSSPSWGYIYLVNLINNKVFNTIFTTNFDDLLNEACYLFSHNVRPIACAHDSSIYSVRITSQRPKIIKLHGDFLFDNIKNTVKELETLEQNTKDKFKQYALEFGFIFLGYSGNDRSVMDTLNTLLRSDNNFPHGIYWCILKGTKLSKKVEALTRYPKFNVVEISGFDEFFAELHDELGIKLQPEMSDPYGSLAKRLNNLINKINLPAENIHPIIQKDIANLGNHIASISKNSQEKEEQVPMPYSLLSDIYARENNYDKALEYVFKELAETPSVDAFSRAVSIFAKFNNWDELPRLMKIIENSPEAIAKDVDEIAWTVIDLMDNNKLDEAEKILELQHSLGMRGKGEYSPDINFINKMIIKVKRNSAFTDSENERLNILLNSSEINFKMAVSILRNEYREAEKYLLQKMVEEKDVTYVKDWTLFKMLLPHITNEKILDYFK